MGVIEKKKQKVDCAHKYILASLDGTYTCTNCQIGLSKEKLIKMVGIEVVEEIKNGLIYLKEIPEEMLQDLAIRETENSKEIIPKKIQVVFEKDNYVITLEDDKEEKEKITKKEIAIISVVVVGCVLLIIFYLLFPEPFNYFFSGIDWWKFWRSFP